MTTNTKKRKETRKLGDEWGNWNGKIENENINTPKHIFLTFAFIAITLISCAIYAAFYLIKPRLYELNPYLPNIVLALAIAYTIYMLTYYLLLLISAYTNIKLRYIKPRNFSFIKYILRKVLSIASFFNYNKDKLANSFLKVSNSFFKKMINPIKSEKLLILLPRCLSKETYKKIKQISKDNNVNIAVCSGGEIARKKIKEYKPDAVIGIACERDLISGISDVGEKIAVFGIANIRPDGPCKDTYINFSELEDCIKFYLSAKKN